MIQVKRSIIFASLLFSVQVGDSMAGIMRSLRDIEHAYYIHRRSSDV
mgnify:FL=1